VKNTLLTIVITLVLVGSLFAGSDPVLATNTAPAVFMDEGSLPSQFCASRNLSDHNQFALPSCKDSPIPLYQVGRNRNNDQLQLRAGDGSPMPVCQPGKNCNNDQLQLRAGDGSPMPVCQPGRNCNNDQISVTIVL